MQLHIYTNLSTNLRDEKYLSIYICVNADIHNLLKVSTPILSVRRLSEDRFANRAEGTNILVCDSHYDVRCTLIRFFNIILSIR